MSDQKKKGRTAKHEKKFTFKGDLADFFKAVKKDREKKLPPTKPNQK